MRRSKISLLAFIFFQGEAVASPNNEVNYISINTGNIDSIDFAQTIKHKTKLSQSLSNNHKNVNYFSENFRELLSKIGNSGKSGKSGKSKKSKKGVFSKSSKYNFLTESKKELKASKKQLKKSKKEIKGSKNEFKGSKKDIKGSKKELSKKSQGSKKGAKSGKSKKGAKSGRTYDMYVSSNNKEESKEFLSGSNNEDIEEKVDDMVQSVYQVYGSNSNSIEYNETSIDKILDSNEVTPQKVQESNNTNMKEREKTSEIEENYDDDDFDTYEFVDDLTDDTYEEIIEESEDDDFVEVEDEMSHYAEGR